MTVAHRWKKQLVRMAAGAVVGAGGTFAVLFLLDGRGLDLDEGGQMLALVAGMIYLLMGLLVGVGALAPNAAAPLLNVEDAEELREERSRIGPAAIATILIGIFFLTLAAMPAGGEGGLVGRDAAAIVAGGCLIALVAITLWGNKRVDELTRQVSVESASIAMQVTLVLLGGWAALSHLGFAAWADPLELLAGLALIQLVAIFWVCTKRGMLNPR